MKLTKYTHACLVVEEQDQSIIIDPGAWADDLPPLENVAGIVITHNHFDHFDPKRVAAILAANPHARVWTTQETANQLQHPSVQVVVNGTNIQAKPFLLQFFGTTHALVYEDLPQTQNVGVLVNNALYYPGDSFTLPSTPVKMLALPVGGPWLKTSETIDFLKKVRPVVFFPTHDAVLSDKGKEVVEDWYRPWAATHQTELYDLALGQSIDI